MKTPLMYLGERVTPFGKITQLFKDRKGEEAYWTGRKGVYFGSVYESEKKGRGKKLQHLMARSPKKIESDWEPSEAERLAYEAHKLVVSARRRENQNAMQLKKPHKDVLKAIELLAPFFRSLDRFDQSRFMSWVENQCVKRIYVKRK